MDTHSSGEDVFIKIRKPYTISKQRERWTEEEHERFLEALKLHGRAWQRIEEHIGTKTAVQIRSHAQKFFSKLEKDAVVKGVPISQAIEIDIPPPRPKRKPTNPYPLKTGACASTSQTSKDGNQIPGLYKLPAPKEHVDDEEPTNTIEKEDGNRLDVYTFSKEAPSYSFGEFVSLNKWSDNQTLTNESNITVEPKRIQRLDNYPSHVPVQNFFFRRIISKISVSPRINKT